MSNNRRADAPESVSGAEQIRDPLSRSRQSRKDTIKRLIIFLVISFVPFIVIVPILCAYFGEPIYASTDPDISVVTYCLGVFGMMIPSCANLITRLVTGEGFKNSYLGANFKGKMGYWIASVAVKLAESVICLLLMWALFADGMSFSDTFPGIDTQNTGLLMIQLAFTVVIFFPAFGEEWGWRGYMMPKLFELMPKPAAVIVGGVIWGLWHAPLTIAGHNFGVDYLGYPFVGIGLMCLMCVLMNTFLTLLTEKTRSIYPATFCHAVNNNLQPTILLSIFGSEAALDKIASVDVIPGAAVSLSVSAAVFAVSFVLLIRTDKKSMKSFDKAA